MTTQSREGRRPLRLPARMAPTDALFWYAEEALPRFRCTIAGLYVLAGRPEAERLDASLDAAIALVPRLRQRVLDVPLGLGLPEWADDPHFDRRYHLRHVSVASPGDERHLLDLAATLFATPFDRERPLWEATWIDGLEGGRSAYLFKMHHSMVDGVGSLAILDAITQAGSETPPPALRPREPAALPSATRQLLGLARDDAQAALGLAGQGASALGRALRAPGDALAGVARTSRGLWSLGRDALQPATRDPLSTRSAGLSRRFDVWQVPLERLRKLKAPLGATVNDLVLAALTAALGGYYRQRGHAVETLKCMVPMNLRSRDERDTLGNRVGIFSIALPVGTTRPELRLRRIVEQMRAAKEDQRGAAAPWLAQPLALIPGAAFRWIARRSLGRVNVACTNIPGVRRRRYMAGATVEAIYPFVSVVEGTPIVVALLSYAGNFHVGIDTDPEAIPEPHRITELLGAGLDELESLASRPPA
jgi:diacylglycerol O-acyltransferase